MFDWVLEYFSGTTMVEIGYTVWNVLVRTAINLLGTPITQIAGGSLIGLAGPLMITVKIIGASLFNLLFFLNFCKRSADLRDNQTMETIISLMIKLILGNLLIVNLENIISGLYSIMMSFFVLLRGDNPNLISINIASLDDWDRDSFLIGQIVSIVFFLVCVGGGLLLVLHVYGIFLKVFFYMVVAPLAIATVPGPEGAARSAENWLKTFLCAFGEFAGMALVLRMCAAIFNSNGFLIQAPDIFLAFESVWNMIQGMLIILLTVGTVKGVDNMIRRAFGF